MRAVLVRDDSSRDLYLGEAPTPRLGPDDVSIAVRATAVNRADLLQRRGFYPPPPGESDILGLEAAGVIAELGANVQGWRKGDRVCCLLGGGGYAEYVAVHAGMLIPIPAHLGFEEAAAVPEVFFTALVNLFLEAELAAGERVLIHAGGSGVGTAAVQLAREAGARVFVTAGSDDKVQRCLALGADGGVNYKSEDFADAVRARTNGEGVDVILDCVGAGYLEGNLALLRLKGRLVIIGLMGGTRAEINLAPVVTKRLRVVGSVLRSRPLAEKLAIATVFRERVLPLLEAKKVRPIVDAVYPLADVAKAHEYVAENRNFGKVVLVLDTAAAG